jgi:hypothetical protein
MRIEHPFNAEQEQRLVDGISALNTLGYFTAARQVQAVLDEQRRAKEVRTVNTG